MKIAVCMKQVPAYSEGAMDEKTGLLVRSGLLPVTNIYDLSALECALQIKEQTEAFVSVFTMGPAKAVEVLRDAYAYGADEGYLVTDKAFAGADVLTTSYTLAQAIQSTGDYDLVLCGRQTTDGDTGLISGALAQWWETVCIPGITGLEQIHEDHMVLAYQDDYQKVTAAVSYPFVASVSREFVPRMPSLKLKMSAKKKSIHTIELASLADQDPLHYGIHGAATKVKRIFPPKRTGKREVKQMDGVQGAEYIAQILEQI